jgi:hypothetical protein
VINIHDIERTEYSVTEPITKAQVKERLKIHTSNTDYDTEIDNLIPMVRKWVENICHISIVNTRIELWAEFEEKWELPYGPVTGVEYVGTVETSIGSGIPSSEVLEEGWKVSGVRFLEFYTLSPYVHKIIYTAGYQTVPYDLKLGLLDAVAYFYRNRGDVPTAEQIFQIDAFEKLRPYVRMQWI